MFGAGNQVRTDGLYLGQVAGTTIIILRRCSSLRSIHDRVELDTVSLLIRLLALILLIVALGALGARANKQRYSEFQPIDCASVTVAISQNSNSRDKSPNF